MKEKNKTIKIESDTAKLQWACRRGMLELDVLLGNFLKEVYPSLSLEDKNRFTALLACSDPQIFSWLLGREKPEDADLAIITKLIRHHAKSRL